MHDQNYTIDELFVTSIAHEIEDGEVVAQGIATPIISAAYLLAKETHAPNLYFMSAIGQGICKEGSPLSLSYIEEFWLEKSLTNVGFARAATEGLPTLKPKEFFRPGQVDQAGNFNNIAFGKNYNNPRLRLPGSGGIPDVTPMMDKICLYVPRHSRVTFVKLLDYLSGLGHSKKRKKGRGPILLVTDLGVFSFNNGIMESRSIHPGVLPEKVMRKSGFDIIINDNIARTIPPTDTELSILRNKIDPLGIRRLEFLSGASRRELLREILHAEISTIGS